MFPIIGSLLKTAHWKKYGNVIAVFAAVFFLLTGCQKNNKDVFSAQQFIMDTVVTMKLEGDGSEQAALQITELLTAFEHQYSAYQTESDIDRINRQAGINFVPVQPETYALLKQAVDYCQKSNGQFDITVGPLVSAWDIKSETPKVPENIETLLPLVNYQDILFNDQEKSVMLKKADQRIDLGGLAKGAAADQVLALLKQSKLSGAVVSLGGNVVTYGDKAYTIGIQDPRRERGVTVGQLTNDRNWMVATTGDYERYFELDGKRYHHILDPKTGYPVESPWMSVTVLCPSGMEGDYLSTTLFMKSREELMALKSREDFLFAAIDKDNRILLSDGLTNQFRVTNKEYQIVSE